MRTLILAVMVLLCCTVFAKADYTYTIDDGYFPVLSLHDEETLLMRGGGGLDLNLDDYSQATIQDTSPLGKYSGGIWFLSMGGYTHLNFSGGEVHEFDIISAGRAVFSGGRIDEIRSYQYVEDIPIGDPPVWIPDPHIEIVCHDDYYWDQTTNILTGRWFDDSAFSIQLVNVAGYDPVIENIFFTPEPSSLLLISIGGLFLRHGRGKHLLYLQ
jgi:hypothetical protein